MRRPPSRPAPLLALALTLSISVANLAHGQPPDDLPRRIHPEASKRVRELIRRVVDSGRLAGGVALVQFRGATVVEEAVGYADAELKQPLAADTLFRLASMSRPVTSVAALMLLDEGKLALDDPVLKFVPEFAAIRVIGPGTETVAPKRPVTVRDLITHTSGLRHTFSVPPRLEPLVDRAGLGDGLAPLPFDLAEHARRIATVPLASQPGEAWGYGLSTEVLGRVIEVASGVDLETFLRERLFRPLRMRETSFDVEEARSARLSRVYAPGPNREIHRVRDGVFRDGRLVFSPGLPEQRRRTYTSAGAGLVTTAGDFARFMRMLKDRGEFEGVRLLRPETVAAMTRNQIGDLPMPRDIYGDRFGLGLGVFTRAIPGGPSAGSFSWGGFYHTYFWVDPGRDLIGILMTQLTPYGHLSLRTDFLRCVYESLGDEGDAADPGAERRR